MNTDGSNEDEADSAGPARPLKGLKSVSLLTLLSRITGLARDAMMASAFGTGWILDAFTLAFRIPNLFRRLFGEGAITAAFLPEFVKADQQEGRDVAAVVFAGVFRRLAGFLLVIVIVIEAVIATAYLTLQLSPRSTLLCELSLILIPYLLFVCLSGVFGAALNGVSHFVLPALAPVLLNLTWFFGGLAAILFLVEPENQVRVIAGCILCGGILQLLLLKRKAASYGITANFRAGAVSKVDEIFRALGPVLFGLSVTQINGIVDSALAWGLSSERIASSALLSPFYVEEGTTGALYLGQRLFQFPLGVFAVALGTVLFPRFAASIRQDDRRDINRDVTHGLQLVTVVGIPAGAGLWLMSESLTNLLFRYQNFDARSAMLTSQMIAVYGTGVWVFSGLLIINRVFYAAGDQVTPVRLGVIAVGLNLMFNVLLLPIFGGPALPLAAILAGLVQMSFSLRSLSAINVAIRRSNVLSVLWRSVAGTYLLIFAVGRTTQFVSSLAVDGFVLRLLTVGIPIAVGAICYASTLVLTGLQPWQLLKEPFPSIQREISTQDRPR